MKFSKLFVAAILSVTIANANDVMQKSMAMMEKGMTHIQLGFLHNDTSLIRSGTKLVEEGNNLFSDHKVIKSYLPKDKKHMINVATNQAKRIHLDANVLNLRLDDKAYTGAANAFSDMLNACARCHAIVRNW
jgi:hypothetical protein